jgi:transketolase
MKILTGADAIELEKLLLQVAYVDGPVNIRFAREATPVVTKTDSPCKFGIANVIRYRGEKENFVDAFDIYLSTEYKSENEDLTIITCGILVPEAMRAAWILKEEFNVEVRVLNVHTIKPIDKDAILKAVNDTGVIVIAEEHQVGGFGNIVAGIIVKEKKFEQPVIVDMIGVEDKFGLSGDAWELFKVFGLTAELIAKKAKSLLDKKR